MFLSAATLSLSPLPGSTATSAFTLSGRASATLKPNAPAWECTSTHAGADLVDQLDVGRDDRSSVVTQRGTPCFMNCS